MVWQHREAKFGSKSAFWSEPLFGEWLSDNHLRRRYAEGLPDLGRRLWQVGSPAEENFRLSACHERIAGDAGEKEFDGPPWREGCDVAIIPSDAQFFKCGDRLLKD